MISFQRISTLLRILLFQLSFTVFCVNNITGQTVNKFDFERIEDNSFLIEEAYNQDPGVIQHISSFQYMNDHTWSYTFTDEWPVPGRTHQLSASIPVINNGKTGLSDILLNYRYQAIYRNRFAFAPRFSFILPTGNYKNGLGNGVVGYQLMLPFSFLLSRKVATHYNAGITIIPNAKDQSGARYDLTTFNYGFSSILLLSKNFNFMIEVQGNSTTSSTSYRQDIKTRTLFINPGIRYAFNFKSGLQIVPGFAFPVGLGASSGNHGVFGYLSFEHPAWKVK